MSDKMSDKILDCPFCGGEAELEEYYETCDGRGDRNAKIECRKCGLMMRLTFEEFHGAEKEFGYTGGYRSQNKTFWNGMHQKLVSKWNTRKPMEDIVERLEAEMLDSLSCYNRTLESNRYGEVDAYGKAIKIVKGEV